MSYDEMIKLIYGLKLSEIKGKEECPSITSEDKALLLVLVFLFGLHHLVLKPNCRFSILWYLKLVFSLHLSLVALTFFYNIHIFYKTICSHNLHPLGLYCIHYNGYQPFISKFNVYAQTTISCISRCLTSPTSKNSNMQFVNRSHNLSHKNTF